MPLLHETTQKAANLTEREIGAIADRLKGRIAGEVRIDRYNRLMYSTDASMYQMVPVGVVVPRDADDVEAAILTAKEFGVPVMPRGGGTGLAGQTTNHAIVIDFSKYMRNVLEVSPEERWARVQPGIVNNHLSAAVKQYGLMYGPDPVTSQRATVGGGIGNNSCGPHSVIYGKTLDHILEIDTILSDGTRSHFAPVTGQPLEDLMNQDNLEGKIYREVRRLGHDHADEIMRRFPKLLRRVMGYNLDDFMGDAPVNLTRIAVGSEGTLVAVTEAKVNLVPIPTFKGLGVVHFTDLIECMESSVPLLEHSPSAVELIGHMIIDNCKVNAGYSHLLNYFMGDPRELLFVEFYGDSQAEVDSKLAAMKADMEHRRLGYATMITSDPDTQTRWYALRQAGLGLAMGVKGDAKPLPYVEDTAVSPEQLPEYVRRFEEIVHRYGTESAFYGHASTGCLHIRPVVNIKESEGVEKMAAIAEEISDLVLEFGGSLTGEHGDGIVRGVFTEKMFGSELYQAFRELKTAFDPDSTMNPGKIIDTPGIRENLRLGPATKNLDVQTYFDFSAEGSFAQHIEMCNSQGACRKLDGGMCPSFMVTREEEHSTRGRATMLRMIVSGLLPAEELAGQRLQDTMELCVECKACKSECPSNVDMAKLKTETLAKYYEKHGVPLRVRAFGNIAMLSRIGQAIAPIANVMSALAPVKMLTERFLKVSSKRPLPKFAFRRYSDWHKKNAATTPAARGDVVLFNDTFTEYMHPEVGKAATRILEALGYNVILEQQKVCCGRPMISKGQLDTAREWAKINVAALAPHARKGTLIVGTEPSCLLTLRDEYPDLLRDDTSREVASQALMLDELLTQLAEKEPDVVKAIFREHNLPPVQVHGHCHQKAIVGTDPTMDALALAGIQAELIDSACCGMAGTFGFEAEHYDMSKAMGSMKLFPAIEADNKRDWTVAISGISCRQQIDHFTSKRPRHVVEYLADALRD
ncbi:MAG: FAD-binding protein [Chloroflexi bacterium]|nr:FAD-binding protein [Chloroflexota bacterium]